MKRYSEFTFKLPALRVLENEHHLIRHLMSEWHPIVLAFEDDAYSIAEAHAALQELRKKIIEFLDTLKNHTEKEQAHMFKMLIKYVGDEQGPVKAVQDEHQDIDAYLGHFLHYLRGDTSNLSLEEMKTIVQDAGEAFEVITFYFVTEESTIFPMIKMIMTK